MTLTDNSTLDTVTNNAPLRGLTVLDMSRVLAGPSATQILGDLGAEVIKIERPNIGDDTRKWGPPFLKDGTESSYYLSTNRNKKSVTLDYTTDQGRDLIRQMAGKADILVENYKRGTLDKYGIGYQALKEINPRLIYCALTGFGQTGPYADRAGYDFMIQAMGGIMSLSGEPDGQPMKTGVAISDLMAGMYLNTGVLAALHHRHVTGEGQFIDISLFDTQIAWLSNAAQYYLTSGQVTPRMGNAHPTIVPYQVFEATDGYLVLAVGNDAQFDRFCHLINRPDLPQDERFSTNQMRVKHRSDLIPILTQVFKEQTCQAWLDALGRQNIPCAPVNNLEDVFNDPQTLARDMKIQMPHPDGNSDDNTDGSKNAPQIDLIGNPIKFSQTPVSYRHAPPKLGADTQDVLKNWLNLSEHDIEDLAQKGVI